MNARKYAVYADQHGVMVLAEDGFASYDEAAQWAALEYGLGNWEVRQYDAQVKAQASALKDALNLYDALRAAGLSSDAADKATAIAYQMKHA